MAEVNPLRENILVPFMATLRDGTQSAVYTDGHAMIWGPGEAQGHPEAPANLTADFWGPPPAWWWRCDRATLLAWARESNGCPECKGALTVEVDHVCECGLCTAKTETDTCPTCGGKNVGRIGTARVNRVLLAPVLERLDGDTVTVTVTEPGRVELHGETRGALVMGLSPHATYKAPEAVMPPPGDTVRSDREATP